MKITCSETQFCTKIRYDRGGGGETGTFIAEMFFVVSRWRALNAR